MTTERSIKLLSSVMLISTNQIRVLRLWLTCFENWPIRILTFAWWMLKTRKTVVSWQVFLSLPTCRPLASLSRLNLPSLPFWTPATQAKTKEKQTLTEIKIKYNIYILNIICWIDFTARPRQQPPSEEVPPTGPCKFTNIWSSTLIFIKINS